MSDFSYSDVFSEIKSTVSLVDEMEKHGLTLKRAGHAKYKCVCPFHLDSDPSLVVYLSEGDGVDGFNCFGCDAGGTVIDFIKLTYKTNVSGALRYFSKNYNLRLLNNPDIKSLLSIYKEKKDLSFIYETKILKVSMIVKGFLSKSESPERDLYLIKPYLKEIDEAIYTRDSFLFNVTYEDLRNLIKKVNIRRKNQ